MSSEQNPALSDPSDHGSPFTGLGVDNAPERNHRNNAATGASAAGVRALGTQVMSFYFRAPVKAFFRTRVEYVSTTFLIRRTFSNMSIQLYGTLTSLLFANRPIFSQLLNNSSLYNRHLRKPSILGQQTGNGHCTPLPPVYWFTQLVHTVGASSKTKLYHHFWQMRGVFISIVLARKPLVALTRSCG